MAGNFPMTVNPACAVTVTIVNTIQAIKDAIFWPLKKILFLTQRAPSAESIVISARSAVGHCSYPSRIPGRLFNRWQFNDESGAATAQVHCRDHAATSIDDVF